MLIKEEEITIEGDSLSATIIIEGVVLEVEHSRNDEKLNNFEKMAILEKDQAPFDFNPYSNLNVNAILKR